MAMTTTASGLSYEDTQPGTGATPAKGQTCVMHYTGWLWVNDAKGSKFDSSVDRGRPFSFPLGQGRVIKGWDEGVASMQVGGKRTLLIPPGLGYGASGAGGVIPPERHALVRGRAARGQVAELRFTSSSSQRWVRRSASARARSSSRCSVTTSLPPLA